MKKVELLSPVGNIESLYQAVNNGADAVYLGGKKFGARKFANNFDYDELINAIKYCHLYGVKIYVTVNTVIFENEFEEVIKYVEFLHRNNVDAVIVQDLGLMSVLRNLFPNLELHASTQCHNHNNLGIKALKDMGIKRVVLAREMSLDEIKKIDVDIEKEVFIHGALCVAYSGCCLFSSMNGGRSGNRGECVGSCRLPYKLYKNNEQIKTDGEYLLSTKSLCTLQEIPKLIESGITSFKIEGRMKSPEYVGYVTRIYRNKIDEYYKNKIEIVNDEELKNLKVLYNREFTTGYLFNNYGKSLMNIKTSNHIGIPLGKVLEVTKKNIKILLFEDLNQEDGIKFDDEHGMIVNMLYNSKGLLVSSVKKGEIAIVDNKVNLNKLTTVRKTIDKLLVKDIEKIKERKVNVKLALTAKLGKLLELTIDDYENSVTVYGKNVESSITSPTQSERVKEQIEKLGNTPFKCTETKIDMDDNIFISIKELNDIRREGVQKLIEKREYKVPVPFIKECLQEEFNKIEKISIKSSPNINILVRNEEQLRVAINEKVNNIYVTDYKLYVKYKKNKNIFYRTRRVNNSHINLTSNNILATELGAIKKYSKENVVVADYFLNITNSNTIDYLENIGVKLSTLSPEIPLEEIELIANKKQNLEIIVYGRVELMISKYCPLNMLINKDNKKCNLCDENNYYLKDKDEKSYPIVNEKHLTHILHCKNINLIDNIRQYKTLGINNYRIELYDEKEKDIIKIIKNIKKEYE